MPGPAVSMQLCAHLEQRLQGDRLQASWFPQHGAQPKGRREGPPGNKQTPRLPSASQEDPAPPPELIIVAVSGCSQPQLGSPQTGPHCVPNSNALHSLSPQQQHPDPHNKLSPQNSEKTPPPSQPEACFPRPARALHCGGYQDANPAQPIVSGFRRAPRRQPMGVQINHLKQPMN